MPRGGSSGSRGNRNSYGGRNNYSEYENYDRPLTNQESRRIVHDLLKQQANGNNDLYCYLKDKFYND